MDYSLYLKKNHLEFLLNKDIKMMSVYIKNVNLVQNSGEQTVHPYLSNAVSSTKLFFPCHCYFLIS